MRIAIVSDIHGNLTSLEAVLLDLRETAPDLILHGGDLSDGGSRPAETLDLIRELGWTGVVGNTDEMLFDAGALMKFASQSPKHLEPLFAAIEERAVATREALGEERLEWLRALPRTLDGERMALVHASPESLWSAPAPEASDTELEPVYSPLNRPIAIYAHIHRPYIRTVHSISNAAEMTVCNTGSVSLSYDDDSRASYLLLDESGPSIRRVEYDMEKEIKALKDCGFPHSAWVARMLKAARFEMP
jgi:predicted phosphodiesterase